MDSEQLYKIINLNSKARKYFKGIYPADKLPVIMKFPASLIVNTDKSNKKGEHWQAIFMPNAKTVEFMDTFGRKPNGPIAEFIENYPNKIINSVKLQASYETSCGPHVIYFIILRSLGSNFHNIIKKLENRNYPDAFVKFYVAELSRYL
jgi:hypothetical protein